MKIGTHVPPHFTQRPLQEAELGGEADPRAAGGFEKLLEAMRLAMEDPGTHAAALQPKIGSHSQAFEQAQLLVEIALDLSGSETPVGAEPGHPRIAERPEQVVAKVRELLERLAATVAPQARSPAGGSGLETIQRGLPIQQDGGGQRHLAGRLPQAPVPSPSRAGHHAPADAAGRVPSAPIRTSKSPVSKGSAPPQPDTGAARHSRFAAQLLAAESGLRVMLRLPRLSEDERSELQARLGQLLESYGHRQREIVIQEIATA
jgi:hypothetical protein